jgi:hypothetical protein
MNLDDLFTSTALAPLTWHERIANYERLIGPSYLVQQNGWVAGTWVAGNSYGKKVDYYGAYVGNYLKRIAALFPDRARVLHLFSGMVDTTAFPGDTLDIRADLNPTYLCNAETCEGVPLHQYDFVLADPPYSQSDAERYGTCMVNRNRVMDTLASGLPSGAYICWLDQVLPVFRKAQVRVEAMIGVSGSTNHRFRVLSVFRKL